MDMHEYQAKDILRRYGIAAPTGFLATSPLEAAVAAEQIASEPLYVKAQIPAGDRAAAGGVRMVRSPSGAQKAAADMLNRTLVTAQTGPAGCVVKRVLVEAGIPAARAFYVAMRIDPRSGSITLIAGPHLRSGIELHLATEMRDFRVLPFSISGECGGADFLGLCHGIDLPDEVRGKFGEFIGRMHRAFIQLDADLMEINPVMLTEAGEFIAADVKLAIDENAMFRHPDLAKLHVGENIDEMHVQTQLNHINYLQMDGNIGIVANGTGLGLATLDLVHTAGGSPANFMDIRTTARSLDIAQGIGMILDNPRTKVLLVNVFGGGMQSCDTVADGLGIAFRRSGRVVPLVTRITGNSETFARARMTNFNLPRTECADMWQAALKATELARGRR